MRQILDRGTAFTAVLASNDESAIGAMAALEDAGVFVPRDVAVIGFDDRLEASAQSPALTTVRHPMFELGYRALTLLLEYVNGSADERRIIRVPTRFIIRESCGCLPGTPDRARSRVLVTSTGLSSGHRQSLTRDRLMDMMSQAVCADMHRLSADEARHLCQNLTRALVSSLEQDDLGVLLQVLQQIIHRTISLGGEIGERFALQPRQRDQTECRQEQHQQIAGGGMTGEEGDHRCTSPVTCSSSRC